MLYFIFGFSFVLLWGIIIMLFLSKKVGKAIIIYSITASVFIVGSLEIYGIYELHESVRDIEVLELLPAGAEKINYLSSSTLSSVRSLLIDFAAPRRYLGKPETGDYLLYEFVKFNLEDASAIGAGYYNNGYDDVYVIKHRKSVKIPEFITSKKFSDYIRKTDTHKGIDIYQIEIRRGVTYGKFYFAWKDKYTIHSSNLSLIKKTINLLFERNENNAYNEFKHLIEKIPSKYWGSMAFEHFKTSGAKIKWIGSGSIVYPSVVDIYLFLDVITSDPRGLHGGIPRGDVWDVWYILLKCADEECVENYTQVLYEQKCFDIKVEGNYIHAKKFDWDPNPEYDYTESGMFPTPFETYLMHFYFFGYEWRGKKIEQYEMVSPEFPRKQKIVWKE